MACDHMYSTDLYYKHCYIGHIKCGLAASQITVYGHHQIKDIIFDTVRYISSRTIGLYACACSVPVYINSSIFWDLSLNHELYTSGKTLTAINCCFSSASPRIGSSVTLSESLDIFNISEIDVDLIHCYSYGKDINPESKKCKQKANLILSILRFYTILLI